MTPPQGYPLDLTSEDLSMKSLPSILVQIFPAWDSQNITIKPVSGGITNMLIKCVHKHQVVLARSYGNNTNLIIDRTSEFNNHVMLNRLGLAPDIYARLANGIIYGYLKGRSLSPQELSNERLYPLISQKLGYWHAVVTREKQVDALWDTVLGWIDIVEDFGGLGLENIGDFQKVEEAEEVRKTLKNEVQWLRTALQGKSRLVQCHCDLLSGNIVVPPELATAVEANNNNNNNNNNSINAGKAWATSEKYNVELPKPENNPVSFIDYEYMLCAPRGFDIANHLAEWQGFSCDKSQILEPVKSNFRLRRWCFAYLVGAGVSEQDIEQQIDLLIDEVYYFFGVPAIYWGIWAAIQTKISSIDFDYRGYGKNRIREYFEWKKGFVDNMGRVD